MKKFLLGTIVISIFYFLSLPITAYLWKKSATNFATKSLLSFSAPWSFVNFQNKLSQEIRLNEKGGEYEETIISLDENFGSLTKIELATCQLQRHEGWSLSSNTFSVCMIKSTFAKANANVAMVLVLERNDWALFSFQIDVSNN